MKYNPEKHHRCSIRLKGYDYSQPGLYFITLCVQNRHCLFGEIENGERICNEYGKIATTEWINTESIRDNIRLHEYIIMPNHIHGIIEIIRTTDGRGDGKDEGKGDGKGDGKGEGKGDGKDEGKDDGKVDGTGEGKGDGKDDGMADGKGDGKGELQFAPTTTTTTTTAFKSPSQTIGSIVR